MLDRPERIGYAVTQSGVDLISRPAGQRAGRGEPTPAAPTTATTHAVPAGFKKEDLVLTDASLNHAVSRTLTELFRQEAVRDTYADPRKIRRGRCLAPTGRSFHACTRESVVLLVERRHLPRRTAPRSTLRPFGKSTCEAGEAPPKALREMLGNVTLWTPDEAQVALLMVV